MFSFFLWDNCDLITTVAGASNFSGLIDSGNIAVGGKGGFADIRFSGPGTPQVGIDPASDVRWRNSECVGVLNSVNSGMLEFEDNLLATIINTAGVWEDVNAVFVEAPESYLYVENSNGILECVSEDEIKGKLTASVSMRRDSGNSPEAVKLGLFQDTGSGFNQIGTSVCIDIDNTSSQASITVNIVADTGDLFKMQIQKPNDTTDVVCTCGQLSVS